MHIENGRIEHTMLGIEDHGILSFYLTITFEGSAQSFGGWALDAKSPERTATANRQPHAVCGAFLAGILASLGVSNWEQLKGSLCRVRREAPYGRIIAIGHIIDDRWFVPADVSARLVEA